MTERENRIRAWRFEHPRWIPFASGLPWLDWAAYGYDTRELEQVCLDHPRICPGFAPGDLARNHARVGQIRPDLVAGSPYRDGWGCQWQTLTTGMVGSVVRHPLADWADFSALSAPDPRGADEGGAGRP